MVQSDEIRGTVGLEHIFMADPYHINAVARYCEKRSHYTVEKIFHPGRRQQGTKMRLCHLSPETLELLSTQQIEKRSQYQRAL